jgi:hypothetical protein
VRLVSLGNRKYRLAVSSGASADPE